MKNENAEQPAQQHGLEMVDDDGENKAVRMFLALYGGACGVTVEQMRKHLKMAGFDHAWPIWATADGHLTKAGAQLWIRHLFNLEQPAQQEPLFSDRVLEMAKSALAQQPAAVREDWGPGPHECHSLLAQPQPIKQGWDVDTLLDKPEQPAQRKPLTDEEITVISKQVAEGGPKDSIDRFVRAIEAAHGIKENT